MMFKVILDHLVGDVARAPYPISNGPKVPAPVLLGNPGEFLLKTAGNPALKAFHQVAHLLGGTVLNMYVYMVLTYDPLENPYIFRIANLFYKITAPDLDIPREHVISILGDPYYMGRQPRYSMTGPSLLISHKTNIGNV